MKIGFEFEFLSSMNRTEVRNKLRQDLGFEFYTYYDQNYSKWNIVDDGSIESQYYNQEGHELISPVLDYNEGLKILAQVFDWMKTNRCTTNKTTGLHVNISLDPAKMKALNKLKFVILSKEFEIAKKFNRHLNFEYCSPMVTSMRRSYLYNDDTYRIRGQIWKNATIDELGNYIPDHRYVTVNFTNMPKYIEFRAMGGYGYHRRILDVVDSINIIASALEAACDPNSREQEYADGVKQFLSIKSTYGRWY